MKLWGSFLLFLGTILISASIHFLFHENTSFYSSIWWVILHMVDSGRLVEDRQDGILFKALGLSLVFFGIFFIATLFSDIILDKGKKLLAKYTDGELPKYLNQHVMIIGNESNIKYFLQFDIRKYLTENRNANVLQSDLVLLVNDKENLDKLRAYIEEAEEQDKTIKQNLKKTYTYCTPLENLDTHKSLRINTASHLILLDDIMDDTGILVHVIEDMISLRKENRDQLLPVNIYISIENQTVFQIVDYFVSKQNYILSNLKMNIIYFNRYELSSRMILNQHLLFNLDQLNIDKKDDDASQYTLLIDGYTHFSHEFLLQLFVKGIYDFSSTKVMIYEKDIQKYQEINQLILRRFKCLKENDIQKLGNSYAKQMIKIDVLNQNLDLNDFLGKDLNFSILIANQNTDIVIEKMIEFDQILLEAKTSQKQISNIKPKLILEISDHSAFRVCESIFQEMSFEVIKIPSILETFKTIKWIDDHAREIHQNYLNILEQKGQRKKNPDGSYIRPTHKDWEYLSPINKGWNNSNWDHTFVKLSIIAHYYHCKQPIVSANGMIDLTESLREKLSNLIKVYEKSSKILHETNQVLEEKQIGQDEIEMIRLINAIAHIEHNRWSIERFSQGWICGDRNDSLKTHPNLVHYNELSNETKDYDIELFVNNIKKVLNSIL